MQLPADAPIIGVPMCVKHLDSHNFHTVGEKYLTAIIEAAGAEGLIVELSESGSLKVRGKKKVINRWQPLLEQHKANIINLLKKPGGVVPTTRPTLPRWCRIDCPCLEMIPLPKEGKVAGCVNPFTESWRRLSWMTECPAMGRSSQG